MILHRKYLRHLYISKREGKGTYREVSLTLYTKINLKWILDSNVKVKTMKLWAKIKAGENILNVDLGKEFLDLTTKA